MMFATVIPIALGGALGALARHYAQILVSILASPFPWGTLAVNVAGCFLIGALSAGFIFAWNPPLPIKLFLITGFLGGFTTFSAFSLDVMTLWVRADMIGAALYVLASVALSIAAAFAGHSLIWKLFA